jgi:fumarylacetoacetase
MALSSWLEILEIPMGSDFSLSNIPFGIISHDRLVDPHPAVAIGDYVLDLRIFAEAGGFSKLPGGLPSIDAFKQETLNAFAALGRPFHRQIRNYIKDVFLADTPFPEILRDNQTLRETSLLPRSQVSMRLPLRIGDYTDFYAGKNHAYNVGVLFRGPANALQPNYTHLPVGYHGRASSVVVSGTPVRRPWGQFLNADKATVYEPCKRLDIELELGIFMCKANTMGSPVPLAQAEDYIFGYVLMNDWSARDIQAWEYVPLGPFNSKNFATTISPWVVLADALEPFRVKGIKNDTKLQSYLQPTTELGAFDVSLDVELLGTCYAGHSGRNEES